jgi:CRP/FNR family transcriptional regulator, cyclic AMP receptor protein
MIVFMKLSALELEAPLGATAITAIYSLTFNNNDMLSRNDGTGAAGSVAASRNYPVKDYTPIELQHARKLLAGCALFRNLTPDERTALAARAHMRAFEAGDTIFLMGAQHDSMVAVLSGDVKISMTSSEGKQIVLAILHPGEVFGEIAMLDGKPRSADAKALTDCSLAVLDRRDVLAALEGNPAAWLGLIEVLCSRLRQTDQHLVEVALLGLPARLAKALLRMTDEQDGQRPDARGSRLSQHDLANLVGAARENVNKCLQEWRRVGIIRIEKRVIRIADRDALEALAEPP